MAGERNVDRAVNITFNATDRTQATIRNVEQNISRFSGSIQSVASPLAGLGNKIVGINAAVGTLGAAFLGFSLDKAITMESAIADLTRVLSDNEEITDEVSARIRQLSHDYATAGPLVVQSLAEFRQAGFDLEQSFTLADTALRAFRVTELSVAEASELLKSTIRGFNLEAEDAGRVLNVVNAISNQYGANSAELFRALSDIAPIARVAGLSLEEMAGIITPVIEVFGSGSESARAFKTGLNRLVDDSDPIIRTLTDIGVFADGTNEAFENSADIFAALARVFPDLTDKQKQFVASQVFGIDQSAKMGEALDKYSRGLEATKVALEDTESSQKEFERTAGTVRFKIDQLVADFGALQTAIGDQLLGKFGGVVESTGRLAAAFDEIVRNGGLTPLLESITPLLVAFDQQIEGIAEALPQAFDGLDFTRILGSIDRLHDSFGGLFDDLDLTKPDDLQRVLQIAIDVGANLIESFGGIVRSWEPFVQAIGLALEAVGDLSSETSGLIGNLSGVAQQIVLLAPSLESVATLLAGFLVSATALTGLKFAVTLSGFGTAGAAAAAALGYAGLAGAIAVAAVGLNKLIEQTETGREVLQFFGQAGGAAIDDFLSIFGAGTEDAISEAEKRWRDHYNVIATEGGAALTGATNKSQDLAGATEQARDALKGYTDQASNLAEVEARFSALEKDLEQQLASLGPIPGKTREVARATEAWIKEVENGEVIYRQVSGFVTSAMDETKKKTDEAKEKTEAYHLKLIEIATDERIRDRELKVELNIAQLEADAATLQRTIDTINTGIESTGSLISGLFDQYTGADLFEKSFLREQIRKEDERRQQQFELQKDITEAQTEAIRERTRQYANGIDIRVDAGDLSPHLQAVLETMLLNARITMNEQGVTALIPCDG